MNSLRELTTKKYQGEFLLIILLIIFLVFDYKIPHVLSNFIDSLLGRIILIISVIYLFLYSNPILAVLFAYVAFELMRKSSLNKGTTFNYSESEEKKFSQLSSFNQFPYTLEQEVVAKMAPLVRSGISINEPSYQPNLDKLYDASYIS